MESHNGIYYPKENNSNVIKALKKDRIWEKRIVDIFNENLTENDIAVDIGAYIGLHTLVLSKICKKVYSFEPQPLIAECFRKTLDESDQNNILFFEKGLSNIKAKSSVKTNNDGDASILGTRPKKGYKYMFPVELDKLDNIVNEPVKLIKIDVEGHEWETLLGADRVIRESKPIIILETFKLKKNYEKLKGFCEKYKYDREYICSDNWLLVPKS